MTFDSDIEHTVLARLYKIERPHLGILDHNIKLRILEKLLTELATDLSFADNCKIFI